MYNKIHLSVQILENMKPIEHKANKEENTTVPSTQQIPADRLARVKCGVGMTVNLGDYQSARIDIGIELPCDIDETATTYDEASKFCYDQLMIEVGTLNELKKLT